MFAKKISKEIFDDNFISDCNIHISETLLKTGKYDEAIKVLNELICDLDENDIEFKAMIYFDIGSAYFGIHNFEKCKKYVLN